jgi:Methyltransferase domain
MIRRLRAFFRPAEVSWHVVFLSQLSISLNPQTYAELGIYEGETFNKITAKRKFAVDISESALNFIPKDESVIKILGTSEDLAQKLQKTGEKIDLLFIDANHDSEAVQADFRLLEAHMSPSGVVCFHDTFPKDASFTSSKLCGDAYLAIPALQESYPEWHFITLPIHPGMSIATKKGIKPTWLEPQVL